MTVQVDCPCCNGTGRKPAGDNKWCNSIAGYDKETHTLSCTNCGGQTMSCRGTGKVNARPDGTPCKHEYTYKYLGRCYHDYTCKHCDYSYSIDSGD